MIHIDPQNAVPIYRQIAEQFRRLIALGALKPGDRLPAVRELAVQTRVNRNTAARAIQHLEAEGIVRTQVGKGTFVVADAGQIDLAPPAETLDAKLDDLIVEAHTLGFPLDRLGPRLTDRIEEFETRRRAQNPQDESGDKNDE